MIICLNDIYFETLEKYVGKKLDIIKGENTIKFYDDVEIQYILEEKDKIYSFYIVERGKRSKLAEYFSEKEMKQELALTIKGLFGEKIDYNILEKCRNIKNLEEGKKLMDMYVESEYYSIMNPEIMKINLENAREEYKYNIYFLNDNNEKKYIEKDIDISFAFFRFYNEARSLKRHFKIIKEYEMIFDDSIENKNYMI